MTDLVCNYWKMTALPLDNSYEIVRYQGLRKGAAQSEEYYI